MHPLEIREERFRLQQRAAKLADGPEKSALEARVQELRDSCPHAHAEEDPEKGWRCRDCDLVRPPAPGPEAAAAPAAAAGEQAG